MAVARNSARLVIDASVARAAGGENAVFPTSKNCRDFLASTLSICHKSVFTDEILAEWKQHQSNFSRTWLVQMFARKKIVMLRDDHSDPEFRAAIDGTTFTDKQKDAMLKDCHLVEAAWAADERVVALDETVRTLFSDAAQLGGRLGRLRGIAWVNPDRIAEDRPIEWLDAGAPALADRKLGNV